MAPTITPPKPTLVGLTEIYGCTPVPLNEITVGEFVAVLVTVRLPAALVAVRGANVTVRFMLCPAARVTAPDKPLTKNPEPAIVACERVTMAVPVFVRAIVSATGYPTRLLPKFKLMGLAETRCVGGIIPIPDTAMDEPLPFVLLLEKTMLPLKLRAEFGARIT